MKRTQCISHFTKFNFTGVGAADIFLEPFFEVQLLGLSDTAPQKIPPSIVKHNIDYNHCAKTEVPHTKKDISHFSSH